MAVMIRFSLEGKRKQPIYRIVVTEGEKKRNGKFLDILGLYNPNVKPVEIQLDQKKYDEWIKKGAKPSLSLYNLLKTRSN